jgi:ubiquinone/menaquinone biosynthesis C-methylase UbiE
MKRAKYPDYGNWISKSLLQYCAFLSAIFGLNVVLLCFFAKGIVLLKVIFVAIAALIIGATLYFLFARRLLSSKGGDVENKVLDLLISHIDWDGEGKVLDIGCGSGALTIKLAGKYPEATVFGLDSWGGTWDYSQKQCEQNAQAEDVADRIKFVPASAAKLPFPNGAFDLVVSNLTFHEVKESEHAIDVVKEALRVLKFGGTFAFQDTFLSKTYGLQAKLIAAVKDAGVSEVEFENTSEAGFIPGALKLPLMLGRMGLITGKK